MNGGGNIELPRWLLICAALLTASSVLIASALAHAIPNEKMLFGDYLVGPPRLTIFFVRFPHLIWPPTLLPIPLLVWICMRQRVAPLELRRMKFVLGVLTVALLLFYGLAVLALHPMLLMKGPDI